MRCRDIMTMDLRWLPVTASVRDAAICMRDNSIGFLPICSPKGKLLGVFDVSTRHACAPPASGAARRGEGAPWNEPFTTPRHRPDL